MKHKDTFGGTGVKNPGFLTFLSFKTNQNPILALKYCPKDFRQDILHLKGFLKFRIRLWIWLGRKF